MPLQDLKPSPFPGRSKPSPLSPRFSHLVDRPEDSPHSAISGDTDIEGYIGSGTDTAGGRTPIFGNRLSFGVDDNDTDSLGPDVRARDHRHAGRLDYDDDPDAMSSANHPSSRHEESSGLLRKHSIDDASRGRPRYSSSRPTTPSTPQSTSRPHFSRRQTMRSQSPDTTAQMAARRKYTYAAIFLIISLVSFVIQTELAAYVQQDLGWNKAYCMLYMTHGSWALLWPVQLVILRVQKWNMPWNTFWRRHVYLLRSTTRMVQTQSLDPEMNKAKSERAGVEWTYLLRTTAVVTSALTIGGLSWYLAVDMTTPSDLTAIYNCSAFFAYAFSVPLLKEPLRLDKSIAVAIAIAGVLVVAYGDSKDTGSSDEEHKEAGLRFLGNIIIGAGSVLYGLYEVLYKRLACPPEGTSAGRGMIFANAFGSCIGSFTLLVLWIPLPILHMTGWETFEMPTGETALWLWVSVLMNATFAGSFLVLISLTSPVLSSVASLLTIFIVALSDWMLKGQVMSLAALGGGVLIIVAFVMLSWSTWREMQENAAKKAAEVDGVPDVEWTEDESDENDGRLA